MFIFYAPIGNFGTITGRKMKHKGAVMEYSMERMNDLMRAYDEYISSCDYIRMPEVYKVIVNMLSRRFWVSDIRAALVVSVMMRGENDLKRYVAVEERNVWGNSYKGCRSQIRIPGTYHSWAVC